MSCWSMKTLESHVVCRARSCAAAAGPVGVEELAARLVEALISVGAEVVALRLEEIGRQAARAVAVVVSQRATHGRHGNAVGGGRADHATPAALRPADLAGEEGVHEQVDELGVAIERLLDLPQEGASDDAPAAPHERDAAVVELPVARLGLSG